MNELIFGRQFTPCSYSPEGGDAHGVAPAAATDPNSVLRFSQHDLDNIVAKETGKTEERYKAKLSAVEASKAEVEKKLADTVEPLKTVNDLRAKAERATLLEAQIRERDVNDILRDNGCDPKHLKSVRILLDAETAIPQDIKTVADWKPIIEKARELHPAAFAPVQRAQPTGGVPNPPARTSGVADDQPKSLTEAIGKFSKNFVEGKR